VSLLDALVFLKNACKSISDGCVRNCWRHAKLLLSELENVQEFEIENLPFEPEQFQTWASTYPDEDLVYQPLTKEDIVKEILSNKTTNEEVDSADEIEEIKQKTPTNQELIAALKFVGLDVQKIENFNFNNFLRFKHQVKSALTSSLKQETIEKFFNFEKKS
jgi:hypothetical protein